MLHVDKGNSLNLTDLFDAATFRAAAANLMYVAVHCVYKCAIHCGRPAYQMRTLYFCPVATAFFFRSFFSSPNLSGRRLDVYHTSTHGVALVRI